MYPVTNISNDMQKEYTMSETEKKTLTFKVQSFRRIPNPYLRSEEGEKTAEMYIAICDVKELSLIHI